MAKKSATVLAYKGFDKDLKCRGFQFEVGKEYAHGGKIVVCSQGFHACTHPMDVWGYYDIGSDNRFAIVEASGEIEDHKDDSKICTSKLTIKAEISLFDMIKASVDWHFNGWFKDAKKDGESASDKENSNLAASGDGSKLAASGGGSNLAASGNYSNLAASGNYSNLAASGDGSKLAASGGGSNVIVSAAKNVFVKGAKNTLICLTHYVDGKPVKFVTGKIGENGLKEDTWYALNNDGALVEANP